MIADPIKEYQELSAIIEDRYAKEFTVEMDNRPASPPMDHHGPTPGALQGDDYQLEYYEDGYPCLDPRPAKLKLAA